MDRQWTEVAYLTKLFATYEIEDTICSRVDENETAKTLTMLTRYMKRNANGNQLAEEFNKVDERTLSQKVLSRHTIYGDDCWYII